MEMKRRQALGLLATAAAAGLEAAPSPRDKFVGTYKLVMSQRTANPMGRVGYEKSGRMWGMITPPRKPPKDPRNITLEEYRELENGLVAYYGTFDVDEAKKTITHHVEASSNPALIGTDLVRTYELSGNRLTLHPQPTSSLIFERMPD
jgi:hypothetical protein